MNNKPFDPELISIDHSDGELPVDGLLQEMGSTGKQEDQRTFSIQDMIECWEAAFYDGGSVYHGHANSPNRVDKGKYFSDKFNIDITKQQ